jgi:hypothetical protein
LASTYGVIKGKRGLSEGSPPREDDLAHLQPARFEPITRLRQDHRAGLQEIELDHTLRSLSHLLMGRALVPMPPHMALRVTRVGKSFVQPFELPLQHRQEGCRTREITGSAAGLYLVCEIRRCVRPEDSDGPLKAVGGARGPYRIPSANRGSQFLHPSRIVMAIQGDELSQQASIPIDVL